MLRPGSHIVNEDKQISYRICHVSKCGKWFAVADMNLVMSASNSPKPKVMSKADLDEWISKNKCEVLIHALPAEMTFSDSALEKMNRDKWIKKRDFKWRIVKSLCSEYMLHEYLYGDGIGEEIEKLIQAGSPWGSRGAYYNAVNRFISLGCTKNALLPFKLKNTGSNYLHFDKPCNELIKRGRGKSDNSKSRSKTRGITNQDKQNILNIARKFKGKWSYKMAHELYQDTYERSELQRQIGEDVCTHYLPHNLETCISYQQFKYHLKNLVGNERILKKRVGNLRYEKDYKAKQGSSIDGVLGATHRYEVDATVLDLYVRYPFDKSGRLTMGRPVLYIVVDVYSTMIVGFYLGFDGPNWAGVSQALVNACSNKVDFAAKFGEVIEESDWPAHHIPSQITIDNGKEYTNSLVKTILKSELGVTAFNFTAIYRGDAKGTVEGTFNALNNEYVHYEPGSIFKGIDRGEKHPSNESLYKYEEVVRKLINQCIYHNNSADRVNKFSWQAVYDDIDVTPQALYLHSLESEMDGGQPMTSEDLPRIHWGFLPEEEATVCKDGLLFRGVKYLSDEAAARGYFNKVVHSGRYKICVKRSHQSCDHLWHKTADGEFIRFDLKNVNNDSPLSGEHWGIVGHVLEYAKQKSFDAQEVKRHQKAKRDSRNARVERDAAASVEGLPESSRKSMQANVAERKQHQQAVNQRREEQELRRHLESTHADISILADEELIDLDNEIYG
ncbi:hypothetical protein [Pseudoalteromonas pernae]|uniref:hypothetical protein n=1 Tax=Pseudoalteromonas pernae TaxID=3118054 RepID=UPI0032423669